MNIAVTGGAGFIGSTLVDRLMKAGHRVTVVDNLQGGRREFIAHHLRSPRFRFAKLDIRKTKELAKVLRGTDVVFHLAANADIARGVHDPTLDFQQTTVGTFSVLMAMKANDVRQIFFTSGSGVYGDLGRRFIPESHGPLMPVSMYGASKACAEALISAFAHLYDWRVWVLRPANITGPRATHGVTHDFVKKLTRDPTYLQVLGDGKQSKAYLHVDDVVDAILLSWTKSKERINIFNLSSQSFVTVNEIAKIVVQEMKLAGVRVERTGGKVGWKGDVPIIRLRNDRLARLGWRASYDSAGAVRATVRAMLRDGV
jgi:UDP-glucose 4-epimerase